MGLLDLLLQNQSNLDINPVPQQGNGPIEPATGEFNTGATTFQQVWNSNNTYLNNFNPNIQPNTLGQTGLDNTNPNFVPSTTLPTDPTIYPQLVQGEFNSTPTLYNQLYNPNNTYLNNFTAGGSVGIQPPTLAQTGLDVDDPTVVPTTTVPNTLTIYPATALGGLGQSAIQFLQIWNPVINYNDVVVGAGISPLEQSLDETGLDVENQNAVPTTTAPNTVTQYPALASGEFNTGASQYAQNYSPTNTYLNSNFTNAQEGTLDLTGLDNTDTSLLPTTISPQQVPATPQILPPQTFMGEFGGAPSQFTPQYNPNLGQGYLNNLNTIISNASNPQISALNETGLDIENQDAAPTTYAVPQVDDVTVYPPEVTGELGGAPSPYNQEWKPINKYYNFMKENYQAR